MKINISDIPLPFFQLTNKFAIIDMSPKSLYFFNQTNNFLELVDPESQEKFITYLHEKDIHYSMEINMVTKKNPPSLFTIEYTYIVEKEEYYVFCHPYNEQYINLQYELYQLKESIVHINEQEFRNIEHYTLSHSDSNSIEKVIKIDSNKKLDSIKRSTSSIIDLLGVITNIIIEDGKTEYLELMYNELSEIKSLVDELKSSIN